MVLIGVFGWFVLNSNGKMNAWHLTSDFLLSSINRYVCEIFTKNMDKCDEL